jgi:hypothetical protein
MVLRSELGKVMLNVAVSKGMLFSKDSRTKKGKKVWHVTFKAIEDEDEGPVTVMLNVSATDIDVFHGKLEEIAK